MSLAEGLHDVLKEAAATLPEDVAVMASAAAAILGGHLDAGAAQVAEDGALRLLDHLFRGSAAAGAVQSLPPLPEPAEEPPAAEAAPEPAPAAETPPADVSEPPAAPQEPPDPGVTTLPPSWPGSSAPAS